MRINPEICLCLLVLAAVKPRDHVLAAVAGVTSLVQVRLEMGIREGKGGRFKVVRQERLPYLLIGEAGVIIDKCAKEPRALVILDFVVARVGEAETVSAPALLVVDNLGVGFLVPTHVASSFGLIV